MFQRQSRWYQHLLDIDMLSTLFKQSAGKGLFAFIDLQFAELLTKDETGKQRDTFRVLFAWLSEQYRKGHCCVKPERLSQDTLFDGREPELAAQIMACTLQPDMTEWARLLNACSAIGDGSDDRPLVLFNQYLYLRRMWQYEKTVAQFFQEKMAQVYDIAESTAFSSLLTHYFPSTTREINWQKIAVLIAITRQVAVISGGPGTGKTTTIATLLAILIEWQSMQSTSPPLRIILAAPTGKAAARLTESLNLAVHALALTPVVLAQMPKEASTLHHLLGARLTSRWFKHNAGNLLHVDLLIVDESSMIDLTMMSHLIKALPPHARLILLGDRNQLASIEAGTLLRDLCHFADRGYTPARAKEIKMITGDEVNKDNLASPIQDALCLLKKSYRFHHDSGIGQLASAINCGDLVQVTTVLKGDFTDIVYHDASNVTAFEQWLNEAVSGYRHYVSMIGNASPTDIITAFSDFQVLSAQRKGAMGIDALNQQIEQMLAAAHLIQPSHHTGWYNGRPVIIRQNNYALNVFNGDIGIALVDPQSQQLRVHFLRAGRKIHTVSPHRLPAYDAAYAMTVHQAQGSEFAHVLFIMPTQDTPLITRELFYTAVTRAKTRLTLFADYKGLVSAVGRVTQRESGFLAQLM